jgi:methyl-accepting chemotaxis protein
MGTNRMRFPMFFKFWLGCSILASLLIVGGFLVVRSETKMKSRGNYLAKHFKRYQNYQAGLGQAVSSVADVLASDLTLRNAITGGGEPGEVGDTPQAIAKSMFDRISGKSSLRPDLFVVFDSNRGLLYSPPKSIVGEEDLRTLEPVSRVVKGDTFFNKMLVHEKSAFQLAGVPIKAPDGNTVVGGLLIGVDVTRYFADYKAQSDDKEAMQHRLTLAYEGEVVASVMPADVWGELSKQLDPKQWGHKKEGELNRPVIKLKQGDFDFFEGDVEGFAGVQAGKVAKLFLLRSRRNLVGRGPTLPVNEMIVGALLSLLVATLLALWITRPIKKFVSQSQAILKGGANLNQRIELGSRDETADLAENINQVFARLYRLAREVQTAAFQVGASSAEISAASRQMLEGLTDQTLKIESSTAAVTELSASIQQVASNAVEATKVAEKSNYAVTEAVDRMQQIRAAVEDAGMKMGELGESSKRIGNIVEVIRQISEQTSLLALNASIEAAHAGEQGRGFAVVADEVSSLARRVGQSAKDIEALIQTIKEQTADAVQSMERGTVEVEGGTSLVTNTLTDLTQLIAVVNDTAAAVQEQAQVSDEIARNMDAVQKIAADMVSGSEEAVVQGEQLHSLAFGLEESVGGFNLDGSTPSPPPDRRALKEGPSS